MLENAAKAVAAHDGAIVIRGFRQWGKELVVQRLVISLCVIVLYELGDDAPQMPLAERDDSVEAFCAY